MSLLVRRLLSWLLGGLMLCAIGFYNGYPLVYPDTEMYIECGFTGEQAIYGRSMAYSFFVRHASLSASLWYVIMAQGLLLSSVMILALKHFLPHNWQRRVELLHLLLITILVLCSGISVRTSQVMPDIFTAIAALGMALILFAPRLPWWERIYLSVLVIWSIMSHTANLASFLLLMAALSMLWGIIWLRSRRLPLHWARWIWGLALVAASWVILPSIHYATGGGFRASTSSPIFFMGQLNAVGILPHFLQQECEDDSTYFLCRYRYALPPSFLWDQKSPLYRMGGWRAADQEAYAALNRSILRNPTYLSLYLQSILTGTLKQFFNFETSNITLNANKDYPIIRKRLYYERYPLSISKQMLGQLGFDDINRRQIWLIYGSLLLALALLYRNRWAEAIPAPLRWSLWLLLILLLTNAVVCGGLSNGAMRYQNRLIWVLPFLLSMVVMIRWPAIVDWLRAKLLPKGEQQ